MRRSRKHRLTKQQWRDYARMDHGRALDNIVGIAPAIHPQWVVVTARTDLDDESIRFECADGAVGRIHDKGVFWLIRHSETGFWRHAS